MRIVQILLIAVGSILALGAALLLLSGMQPGGETQTISVGAMIFSFGCVLLSAGLYLRSKSPAPPATQVMYIDRAKKAASGKEGVCDKCRARALLMRCLRHGVSLCADCLRAHDSDQTCSYRPPETPRIAAAR